MTDQPIEQQPGPDQPVAIDETSDQHWSEQVPWHADDQRVEHLCEVMHDAYEKAAAGAGWETQEASRKPWSEVPEPNKVTMRAAVRALLDEIRI